MYVCMYGGVYEILWRGMTCTECTVWQVAGSSALSYCNGRNPYLVSGMEIYSSVQEEGDCAIMTPGDNVVKSGPFLMNSRALIYELFISGSLVAIISS
jgi:hypothetical protein